MSETAPDAVGRTIAAIRREQGEIARQWVARLPGDGVDSSTGGQMVEEAAARLVGTVCDRLWSDGQPPLPNPISWQDVGGSLGSLQGSARGHALALAGLESLLMATAATELQKGPPASLAEAFRACGAIVDAVASVRTELANGAADGAAAGGAERLEAFARAVAHELKNPLGAARNAADLLVTGEGLESAQDRARFAELVLRNVNRALELLDEVRARGRSGDMPAAAAADRQALA
jgi:signal transduction histidine kinase